MTRTILLLYCFFYVTDGMIPYNHTNMTSDILDTVPVSQIFDHKDADDAGNIVTTFLEAVEEYEKNKENCTVGTEYNLGKGLIKQYGILRFKRQAMVAVNRANLLTRIWRRESLEPNLTTSEYLLYALVRNMVEGDDDIFAAGNCYDGYEFKNYYLFCPYAYRLPDGSIMAKDLSVEYPYLSNGSEWFYEARIKANDTENFENKIGWTKWRLNETEHMDNESDVTISVTYDDGHWSLPYFDCGGGNIWMMTYTVPFFGYRNDTFYFKGTSGIDIDLQKVDIDQCPQSPGSTELNVFADSARCRTRTTQCAPIRGLGFRRGSYTCVCRRGFYYPDLTATHRYYNGTDVEEEFDKKRRGETNQYNSSFECLPCKPGCDECMDPRPCVLTLNWIMRSLLLGVSVIILLLVPALIWFTVRYSNVKVLKAASPVLLRIILLGAIFLYSPLIVGYFDATVLTCCLQIWFREIGFSVSYGALLLKTWRISVVFRVRSAQRVKISDYDLMKRLVLISSVFVVFLITRTVVARPSVIEGKHTTGLKAYQCSADWWDHSSAISEILLLLWGVRLCIVVRKAPTEFNESRFISLAIYNETVLAVFVNVSMIFLKDPFPSNPDLLYLVHFIHTQLTTTVTLAFLFGSKLYVLFKYRGREQTTNTSMIMSRGSKTKNSPTKLTTMTKTANSSDKPETVPDYSALMEKDIQAEFGRLYTQLELLKQRNMQLGNPHIQNKLSAMTDAVKDTQLPNSTPNSPDVNGKRIVINLDNYHEGTRL